jgi:hypothetical protein
MLHERVRMGACLMRGLTFLIAVALLIPIGAAPTAAAADRRIALVIANAVYAHAPPLSNRGDDAEAVGQLFKGAGFDQVDVLHDVGAAEFRRALRQFGELAREADIAVIYYAGLGIELNRVNYAVPVDAVLTSDTDVEDETIALDRMVKALDPARRLRLVILDASRDNPFLDTMRRQTGSRSLERGLARTDPEGPNTLIAYAARDGTVSVDGDSGRNPFTTALIKHIAAPGLDVRLAFGRVRDEVLAATGNRQEPFLYGSLGGTAVALVDGQPSPQQAEAATAAASTRAAAEAPERRDYELAERVGTPQAWELFLSHHPTGSYAGLARAQREKLAAAAPTEPPATPDQAAGAATGEAPSLASATAREAGAAPAEVPASRAASTATPAETTAEPAPDSMARSLQAELTRVGCYAGPVNGSWDARTRHALAIFNDRAKTRLDITTASSAALETVRQRTDRICAEVCARGFRLSGDTCVRQCRPGTVLEDGRCHRQRARAARGGRRDVR